MDSSQSEYECPDCRGSLIRKKYTKIQLLKPCERCGGTGNVDWVRNIVSSASAETSPEAEHGATMANIQMLRNLIIEEGTRVGIYVTVNLEFKNMNEYLMKAASPMIIKGGKINVPY